MTERKMYLITGQVDKDVMATMPPETATLLFLFQSGDLNARWRLNRMAEGLWESGNRVGGAHLINACQYLKDRAWYQQFVEQNPQPPNSVMFTLPAKEGQHD